LFLKIDEILRVYAEMSPKLISKSVVLNSCCWKIRSSILGSESTLNFGTSFTLRKTLYFSGIFLLYQKVTISQQTFGTFIVITCRRCSRGKSAGAGRAGCTAAWPLSSREDVLDADEGGGGGTLSFRRSLIWSCRW